MVQDDEACFFLLDILRGNIWKGSCANFGDGMACLGKSEGTGAFQSRLEREASLIDPGSVDDRERSMLQISDNTWTLKQKSLLSAVCGMQFLLFSSNHFIHCQFFAPQ